MAAFATSSEVVPKKYDVFISFRGSDIRDGFLSHLTNKLRQEEIDVYVDERLEKGDEISTALVEAIESSIIALVIFSKDYASSRWCLEELVKIMECKRLDNQIVIPIFYNVDPSHVRHQEGSYADAFAQHEQKYSNDLGKLQTWKYVLKDTANLSGYHSSNYLNEFDLINEITNHVSKKLEDTDIIEPKHQLIGFEENMAVVETFMKVDPEEVRVIGIWGKGGVGKTTLAQAVFDKFSPQYDSSCFVSSVREQSKGTDGLRCLLENILSVLLNDKNLTQKRRPNTQRRLRRKRVLLVLDDVDTSSHLQYLLEENLSLGPNSRIIITSRDKHVLTSGGVHAVHEVKQLNMKESLHLFCWHAFKQHKPKSGYEDLSKLVIRYAGGLPLALKVLGLYLNSRKMEIWKSALEKLRKYPNVEIYNVLRVSYDGLDIPEKRMFLDIAFFFLGKKKEDIIRVLDGCGDLYPDCGIDSLINKALITISSNNRVGIHDLLQEMAEEIVREESREHPEGRSRLNDRKEIDDVLKNEKGTPKIEGILLKLHEIENLCLSPSAFKNMPNLRFLEIRYYGQLKCYCHTMLHLSDGGLDSLSDKLNYICWNRYPLKSLPLGFCAEKLVEIQMCNGNFEKLWDGVQDLKNLKTLDLSFSLNLVELPDLSMAQNLEIVDLSHCERLCNIPPCVLSLPELSYLDLSGCKNIESLHGDKHMKSLKHLMLEGCVKLKQFLLSSEEMRSLDLFKTEINTLKLPIGRFSRLEKLKIGGDLKSLEINELRFLTSLKTFNLHNFRGPQIHQSNLRILFDAWRCLEVLAFIRCGVYEIPDNISSMSLLRILSLRECKVKGLPNSIKHLSKLKELYLGYCNAVKSLPELPPSITHFYAENCTSLKTLDFNVMGAIHNNYSREVKVCYPGGTIPKGFRNCQKWVNSFIIKLALSSSDHLLGFASSCVLSASDITPGATSICRKFYFEKEVVYHEDEDLCPCIRKWRKNHVYVWYDPMESTLKEIQRSFDVGTTYKVLCEFSIRYLFGGGSKIRKCGIRPVYASDLQEKATQ